MKGSGNFADVYLCFVNLHSPIKRFFRYNNQEDAFISGSFPVCLTTNLGFRDNDNEEVVFEYSDGPTLNMSVRLFKPVNERSIDIKDLTSQLSAKEQNIPLPLCQALRSL